MSIEQRWCKISDAAKILGVHRGSLYRAVNRKQIPAIKYPGLGVRVDMKTLETQLEKMEAPDWKESIKKWRGNDQKTKAVI